MRFAKLLAIAGVFWVCSAAGHAALNGAPGPDSGFDDQPMRTDGVALSGSGTMALLAAGLVCLGLIRRRSNVRVPGIRGS